MKKNELHLYLYPVDNLPTSPSCTLTAYENLKLSGLTHQHKAQYKQSRFLLRKILSAYNSPEIFYHPSGKPDLHSSLTLSISHSRNIWVLGIMNAHSLGIDIELKHPSRLERFAKKYPHLKQESLQHALHEWKMTEAYCKCTQKPLLSTLRNPVLPQIHAESLYTHTTQDQHEIVIVSTEEISTTLYIDNKQTKLA